MLRPEHISLLVHLRRFAVAEQDTCLLVLDTEKTRIKDKLLYSLRPLVKNGYISRRKDDLYGLLKKGCDLVSCTKPVLTAGGDEGSRKRVAEVSHMAALLGWSGIPTVTAIPPGGQNGFVPSAIWRTLRNGLISTTRFLGVLFYNELRLAVYHIGDGDYEWQLRAECSLHFRRHDKKDTQLTGILLVCDNGYGFNIGKKIIRRTLRDGGKLLKPALSQNSKPVRYSTSPICVRADYKHAYLAEESEIMDILRIVARGGDWCDLLHLAYFYNHVKTAGDTQEHHLHLPERYAEWGAFLKLPVTVHTLSEEDIHCLNT